MAFIADFAQAITASAGSIRRWTRIVGVALGLTSLTSIVTLIASTIFYRTLPIAQAGDYGLFLTLTQTLMLIAGVGQGQLLFRLYNLRPVGSLNWHKDGAVTLGIVIPPMLLGVIICHQLYQFSMLTNALLFIGGMLSFAIYLVSQLLATQRLYTTSTFWLRLPNALMLIPALLTLLIAAISRIEFVLLAQVAIMALVFALGLRFAIRRCPVGTERITWRERWQGIPMLLSMMSTIVPDQLLVAVAAAILVKADLASLLALIALFRPAQLLDHVLGQIIGTEVARRDQIQHTLMIALSWGAFAAIAGGAILLMPFISSFLYKGRYDFAAAVIPYLAISNALDLTETLPRSYVYGRAKVRLLNIFIGAQVVIALISFGLGVVLITRYGLVGAGAATMMAFVLRNLYSYGTYTWMRFQKM